MTGAAASVARRLSADELRLASRAVGDGLRQTDLSVPGISCGGCIRKIEDAVGRLPGVARARVNLSTKRLAVDWRESDGPPPLGEALAALGYDACLHATREEEGQDPQLARQIRALAVAGFASMNIMGLSVSVWSGAAGETRDLFHWLSAAIALPTLLYSGRIFFASAWSALRRGQTNMDVPISIGVLLAFAMSLYDTIHHQPHAYFDAAISLLFFLLIGRTLDHVMREKARTAVKGLGRLAAYGATVIDPDGARSYRPTEEIEPGMTLLVPAGERIPVDATVREGRSDIDASIATGESVPEPVLPGSALRAGTLNLTGPLILTATAAAKDSFLAEMIRLMEAAEGGRSRYRRLADRAARLYAPVVHSAAALSFLAWMLASGDWHRAVTIAVAVLIITCPCALGLAVPMVQVVAAKALFERGIMVKDGSAMERLAEIDTVLFDKTGTLTSGRPRLRRDGAMDDAALAVAARMAAHSRHPYAQALAEAGAGLEGQADIAFDGIAEQAGQGLEAQAGGELWRLGRAEWALDPAQAAGMAGTVLARNGRLVQAFAFEDELRPGAAEAAARLRNQGLALEIVSGDTAQAVAPVAADLGIDRVRAGLLPSEKTARLTELGAEGRRALMVGDGLNDAPALVAAHVSIAPGSAADVGRQAADFVFLRSDLRAVPDALAITLAADRLIRQNFAFAVLYNVVALPVAIAGHVTPLVAALAMSGSSILVVANALRLGSGLADRPAQRRAGRERPARALRERPA
ncbi:heavy metal translocating P-type ATPase [Sphingobium jiangsuense]|nr:heavy metal translocating P-type ATPase [Sphingobium jiangsuense]